MGSRPLCLGVNSRRLLRSTLFITSCSWSFHLLYQSPQVLEAFFEPVGYLVNVLLQRAVFYLDDAQCRVRGYLHDPLLQLLPPLEQSLDAFAQSCMLAIQVVHLLTHPGKSALLAVPGRVGQTLSN